MITYTKQIIPSHEDETRLEILGNLNNLLFFDIETTGFNRQNDHLISITFMYLENQDWQIKQLFAESISDELLLLNESKPLFDTKDIHITYNGNTFDVPFLNAKYNYYNISAALNKSKSYDLYRIAKNTLVLDNYKLKTIEMYLGISRTDQISGLECIENYKKYLETNDLQYANLILDHNFEDVLNLMALTKVIDCLTSDRIAEFKIRSFSYGQNLYYFKSVLLKNDYIEVQLWNYNSSYSFKNPSFLDNASFYYENGAQLINGDENTLSVRMPIYHKTVNENTLVLIDLESFDRSQLELNDLKHTIVKYNQHLIYDNIILLILNLFEKALA